MTVNIFGISHHDSWPYAKQFPRLEPTVINYQRERERKTRVVWEFKGKMFYFTQRSGGKRESISGVESGHLQ